MYVVLWKRALCKLFPPAHHQIADFSLIIESFTMKSYLFSTFLLVTTEVASFKNIPRYLSSQVLRQDIQHVAVLYSTVTQWDLFVENHVGDWKGIKTGYDPDNDDVADNLYYDTNLQLNSDGLSITQIDSMVVGEIRTDCEVCHSSHKINKKPAVIFTSKNLKAKYCQNVEIKGPAMTPRGISCEVTFRQMDSRIRVLFALAPSEFKEKEGFGQIPVSMKLSDIVITRENLINRPLDADNEKHFLWNRCDSYKNLNDKKFDAIRYKINGDNCLSESSSLDKDEILSNLPYLTSTSKSLINTNTYRRCFPGGIILETPVIVKAGELVTSRVISLLYNDPRSNNGAADVVAVTYSLMDEYNVFEDRLIISPPILRDYYVEKWTVA